VLRSGFTELKVLQEAGEETLGEPGPGEPEGLDASYHTAVNMSEQREEEEEEEEEDDDDDDDGEDVQSLSPSS